MGLGHDNVLSINFFLLVFRKVECVLSCLFQDEQFILDTSLACLLVVGFLYFGKQLLPLIDLVHGLCTVDVINVRLIGNPAFYSPVETLHVTESW